MSGAKPVAISCGEPAGIGPEIAASAWAALRGDIAMVWLGDPAHLPAKTPYQIVTTCDEATAISGQALPVMAHDFGSAAVHGTAQPSHAQAVIDVIARGVDLVRSAQACALCTAPIHKKALQDGAGFSYPGHTEYLAALGGGE
jgi:4-hydroxythreonine-4-phosphate dehydrogenase